MAYSINKVKPLKIKEQKNSYSFKRDKSQENGTQVYRWYENKNGDIISVVEGYFPNEANVRVSSGTGKFDSFEIRGGKDIILGKTDEQIISSAMRGIQRREIK